MKKYKISMKGITLNVKAENIQDAQEKALVKAENKGKDKTILWIEPEGEAKIYFCEVCKTKTVDKKSGSDVCYDCTIGKK